MIVSANPFTVTPEISCGKTFFVVEGVFPINKGRIDADPYRGVFSSRTKAVAISQRYSKQVVEDVIGYLSDRAVRVEAAQAYLVARAARAPVNQIAFDF